MTHLSLFIVYQLFMFHSLILILLIQVNEISGSDSIHKFTKLL